MRQQHPASSGFNLLAPPGPGSADRWLGPVEAWVKGDEVHWRDDPRWESDLYGSTRTPSDPVGLLAQFESLAGGSAEAVAAFITKFGEIDLCRCGLLPYHRSRIKPCQMHGHGQLLKGGSARDLYVLATDVARVAGAFRSLERIGRQLRPARPSPAQIAPPSDSLPQVHRSNPPGYWQDVWDAFGARTFDAGRALDKRIRVPRAGESEVWLPQGWWSHFGLAAQRQEFSAQAERLLAESGVRATVEWDAARSEAAPRLRWSARSALATASLALVKQIAGGVRPHNVICVHCGIEFTPYGAQKTCSDDCRRYWRSTVQQDRRHKAAKHGAKA